jgi:hypothetical protein
MQKSYMSVKTYYSPIGLSIIASFYTAISLVGRLEAFYINACLYAMRMMILLTGITPEGFVASYGWKFIRGGCAFIRWKNYTAVLLVWAFRLLFLLLLSNVSYH